MRLRELENKADRALEEQPMLILFNSKNGMCLVSLDRLNITEAGCCPVCHYTFDEGKCSLGQIDFHAQVFCNYVSMFLQSGHALDIQWWTWINK